MKMRPLMMVVSQRGGNGMVIAGGTTLHTFAKNGSRYLVLASASYLRLSLLCTSGMPIADMLAHSPPLPLILNYGDGDRDVTLEDEEGILLALRHRHRVCHIHFSMPASGL
jgi:hypothetical protein